MKCREWILKLEELAPSGLACDWDNVGFLLGRREKDVKKVYLTLDVTDEVVETAINEQVDLIISHHPLIFSPIKRITDADFIGRRVLKLLANDIAYYAMHTNFDAAPGGMADLAAQYLKLQDGKVLHPLNAEDPSVGFGRFGRLPEPMDLKTICEAVKKAFTIPSVIVYGDPESPRLFHHAAVAAGSGKQEIRYAAQQGIELLITGDIGHHEGLDALAQGVTIIDAGHYGTEYIFVAFMKDWITQNLSGQAQVLTAKRKVPFLVL